MKPGHILHFFTVLCIYLLPQLAGAQKSLHVGTFNKLILEIPVSEKWSLYSDNEIRSVLLYDQFYHAAIRLGLSHKLSKEMTLTFAGGYYENFNGGEEYDNYRKYDEFRLWQQGAYRSEVWHLEIENRIRIEEVMTHQFPVTLRYRLQAKLPLNNAEFADKTLYLVLNDEVFFGFSGGKVNRNRLFGGLGFRFGPKLTLQSGILQQTDYKPINNIGKTFAMLQAAIKL